MTHSRRYTLASFIVSLPTCYRFAIVRRNRKPLYVLQNRALKAIHKLPTKMTQKVMYVHQCINGSIHHNMKFEQHTLRQTRAASSGLLKLPNVTTIRYGLEAIKYKATRIYNSLPSSSIKEIEHITQFKRALHKWTVQNGN